jgi:hypothetical protein
MYLAAHAAGKPSGPTNLYSEEDNQMFNKQYHAATIQSGDHASGHLARPWCICQQDCSHKVYGQLLIPHCSGIPHCVVAYCVALPLQNGIGALSVAHHQHIVAINVCGAVNSYPYNPKLVTETSCGFYTVLHCNKLSAKYTCIHSRLSLGEPHNGRHIQINDKICPLAAPEVLSCMVRIHKDTEV